MTPITHLELAELRIQECKRSGSLILSFQNLAFTPKELHQIISLIKEYLPNSKERSSVTGTHLSNNALEKMPEDLKDLVNRDKLKAKVIFEALSRRNLGEDNVIKLLEDGVDLEYKNSEGLSIYEVVFSSNHNKIKNWLLKKEINKSVNLNVVANNDAQPCNFFLDIFIERQDGNTPLHKAAESGDIEKVKAIIDEGTDVDERNDNGDTPFHLAAKNENAEVSEVLMKAGADAKAENKKKETPWGSEVVKNITYKLKHLLAEGRLEQFIKNNPNHESIEPLKHVLANHGTVKLYR